VISLWSLLTKHQKASTLISCVTPLSGNVASQTRLGYYWKYLTSAKFRADASAGNFYGEENYFDTIASLFQSFDLKIDQVTFFKGLSTDLAILNQLKSATFDLIYIDGDHSKEVVEKDIQNFSSKVNVGGYLVMDDASCNLPGAENGEYWKGHQSVADACEMIPALGFVNVLNVGHNRIYQRK
jgi:hypothetical protein